MLAAVRGRAAALLPTVRRRVFGYCAGASRSDTLRLGSGSALGWLKLGSGLALVGSGWLWLALVWRGGSDVGAAGSRADRSDSAAALTRPAPAGPRGTDHRARHAADHGGGAVPGVPADPLVPRCRPGLGGTAVPAGRRGAARRLGGRRHGPAPAADGGAGADGRLQRGHGGQRR